MITSQNPFQNPKPLRINGVWVDSNLQVMGNSIWQPDFDGSWSDQINEISQLIVSLSSDGPKTLAAFWLPAMIWPRYDLALENNSSQNYEIVNTDDFSLLVNAPFNYQTWGWQISQNIPDYSDNSIVITPESKIVFKPVIASSSERYWRYYYGETHF